MGKISDALKRVMEEREIQRQIEKTQNVDRLTKVQPVEPGNGKQSKEKNDDKKIFTLEERIKLRERFLTVKDGTSIDPRLVTHSDSASPIADQYRIVRANLKSQLKKYISGHKLSLTRKLNAPVILAVTSSLHNEGKTVTAANLAIALAQDLDSRVLLVDCDLRNGSVHKMFNLANEPGLSDLLHNDFDYSVALTPTLVKNLFVIPHGNTPANSSELVSSKRMRALLEHLRGEPYTFIILDTPPLTPFSDAALIGTYTDGALMVVQANRTQRDVVKKSKEFLESSNVKVLGTILNRVGLYEPDMYGYYNYYYRHAMEQ